MSESEQRSVGNKTDRRGCTNTLCCGHWNHIRSQETRDNYFEIYYYILKHNSNASFTKHPKYWEFVFLWLSECDKLVQSRLMYKTEVCCLISGILIDVANIWSQDWVVVTRQEMVLFSLISEAIPTCHNHTAGERAGLPWQPSHRFISTGRGLSFAVITDVFRTHTYWSVSYNELCIFTLVFLYRAAPFLYRKAQLETTVFSSGVWHKQLQREW